MNARREICNLFEDADLNLGSVGIEIEMLARKDLVANRELEAVVRQLDFTYGFDDSVTPMAGSLEELYTNVEISIGPDRWDWISKRLMKMLAYLKHEDYVAVSRKHSNSPVSISTETDLYSDGAKKIRLARARVPQNFSAGVHIHFDANSWFSGTEHAARFVKVLNRWIEDVPRHLPVQRYGNDGERGHEFARIQGYHELNGDNWGSGYIKPAEYFHRIGKNVDRFMALNVKPALKRGDIEFRFMHGTLNYATIAGWFETLAELMTYAQREHGGFSDFVAWSAKKAPETKKFIEKSYKLSKASKEPIRISPSRAAKKILNPRAADAPVSNPA